MSEPKTKAPVIDHLSDDEVEYEADVSTPKEAASCAIDAFAGLQNDLLRYVRTVARENKRRFDGKIDSVYGEVQLAFIGASILYTKIKDVVQFADQPVVRYHLRRHMQAVLVAQKSLMEDLAKVAVLRQDADDENMEQVAMLAHVLERVMFTVAFADKRFKFNAADESRRMGRKKTRAAKGVWQDIDKQIKKNKRTVH